MSTKTNVEYAANSYNAGATYIGTMGRDSPGALLDMLAEVASRTLHSEKKQNQQNQASKCKSKVDLVKRKSQDVSFTLPQLLVMPASQLVKQFSIFTSDELKRQYSYTCALIPGCEQKYTSFASEGRARISIKTHLSEHLEFLKANTDAYDSFTAVAVKYKKSKSHVQSKKAKLQQSKKPQETLNKENKDVMQDKSSNYLRKILLSDINLKEFEKEKSVQKINGFKDIHGEIKDVGTDCKVLGDHSYFERAKEETSNISSSNDTCIESTGVKENIVLMVVGADSVHMKEYPHIAKETEQLHQQEQDTVYLSEIDWGQDTCDKNMEVTSIAKPKGKAKFIGTSKEEREMALAFMDRIKKKGNPTGSNLQCRICDPPRTFTAPTTLVSHYRSHAGIKPYECRICRAVFTRRHSLKYHMLIHQNQTRFTCADCGKKFRHPSHFREHRRRHTGEAPFGCDDCGQRFKTRNTYKRHLKTRHGKVLTTTGELLFLSEEDFEKVRTNKKKKTDHSTPENVMDEDVIAPNAIIPYENNLEEHIADNSIDVEQVICSTGSDENHIWEAKDVIRIMKDEGYEICAESHINKTEYIETEVSIASKNYVSDEGDIHDRTHNKTKNLTTEMQNVVYNNIKIMQQGNGQILCQEDIENQNHTIYDDTSQIRPLVRIQYNGENNVIKNPPNCVIEYDENVHLERSDIQETQNNYYKDTEEPTTYIVEVEKKQNEVTEAIHEHMFDEETSEGIIIPQNCIMYEGAEKFVHVFDDKLPQHVEQSKADFSIKVDLLKDSNKAVISNNFENSEMPQTATVSGQAQILDQEIISDNYECSLTCSLKEDESSQFQETVPETYIHADSLNGIVIQNDCVGIFPSQLSMYQQSPVKLQITDLKKFKLLNKHTQSMNLLQNGKQGTILLLSGDALKNSILHIDQNNIVINDLSKPVMNESK